MRNGIFGSFDELDAKGSSSYVLPLSLSTYENRPSIDRDIFRNGWEGDFRTNNQPL